ncbi:hypothetical protein IWQ60_005075 [Tieghemiomyces parasiticus]|uniref:RRM domain-containing protein n=1 Tax=Tieghemiomyces parasiticus TaxID=78921 RepID=A0A9W8A6Z7_9FUNG|nr:hypothetical protein IWQ60_005075 [Tieghemiomyces parasiticus]
MATFAYPEPNPNGPPAGPAPTTGGSPSPVVESNPKAILWMGGLEPWMDQNYLRTLWYNLGEQVNVKCIYNRATGNPANYCFVEFAEPNACAKALSSYNGTLMPGTEKVFRLNWASGGISPDGSAVVEKTADFPIFVGDLGSEVNDYLLLATIQARFPSCHSANVKVDSRTGAPRGYGFARFTDEGEYRRALVELNGFQLGSRPIRVSTVTPSPRRPHPGGYYPSYGQYPAAVPNGALDPNNTTVFVGGLVQPVTEGELRQHFQSFGVITHVKIPQGKGCAFVQFQQRPQAEMAIAQLNGSTLGASSLRLSWGRGHGNGHHHQGPQPPQQQHHHHHHHHPAGAPANGHPHHPHHPQAYPHPHAPHHHPQGPPQPYGRMNGAGFYPPQHRGNPHYPQVGFRPPHREPGAPALGDGMGYPQDKDNKALEQQIKASEGYPTNGYGVQA